MKSFIAERNHDLAPADILLDIERECQTWDWVRAAGVSAEDLRKAVRGSLGGDAEAAQPPI